MGENGSRGVSTQEAADVLSQLPGVAAAQLDLADGEVGGAAIDLGPAGAAGLRCGGLVGQEVGDGMVSDENRKMTGMRDDNQGSADTQ